MKINWNFLGEVGMQNKKTFRGGSMGIFWNCTMSETDDFPTTAYSISYLLILQCEIHGKHSFSINPLIAKSDQHQTSP